jgi:Fur family ferric uptake transcriptional regulator
MSESKELDEAKAVFTQFMERNNMRKTMERYAILEAIYQLGKHITADELHAIMKEKFRVSRGTVYNTLEMLYRANLVRRHQFETAIVYEKYASTPHYHMICTECGTITEFQNATLKNVLSTVKLRGFNIADHTLYVYGTCSGCRRKIGRMKKKLLNNNDKKTL